MPTSHSAPKRRKGRARRFESRGTPHREVYLLTQHVSGALNLELAAALKPYGVTPEQYHVLRILEDVSPGGLPCSTVGARAVSGDPDVTRLLDRLERQGWASRSRNKTDRRVVMAAITRQGLQLLDKVEKQVALLHARQLDGLGARELVQLRQLLERLGPPGE
jgi:DNA-binding MarR family transcriptional regulator